MLFDTQLQHAFQLASFLHTERRIALNVVIGAAQRFNHSLSVQYKRLYYQARGDSGAPAEKSPSRYKTILSDSVLLQRLVYAVSEPYELRQEQSEEVTEADLRIRFIKHLMIISLTRNSFHVAIAISRLLYNYTTPEASAIYQQLLPSGRSPRDESYWRVRKGMLMRELKERFGDKLRIRRGYSGEDRFLASPSSTQYVAEVEHCLEIFKPWGTLCLSSSLLGTSQASGRGPMTALFHANDPDREHLAEEVRMHALVHPPCFAHLVQALGLAPPMSRLEVPLLPSVENRNGRCIFDRAPATLTEDELCAIKQQLDSSVDEKESGRRERIPPP